MSSGGLGMAIGVGLGIGLGAGAVITLLRRGERADVRRADRFAREQDLWLPPELARSVGARLRRRQGLGQLLSALAGGPLLGWTATMMLDRLQTPAVPDRIDFNPGLWMFVVLALPVGLINAAVHLWDVSSARRPASTSAVAPVPVRREHVVPSWLTWTCRGLAVVPPILAAGFCGLHGRIAQVLLFAALAVAAGLATWGVEQLHLRVLNARRALIAGPELAFDEALRVTTVLSTALTVPMAVALAGAACCVTLNGAGPWVRLLFDAWMLPMVLAAFVVNAVVSTPGVRRYYRRRLPLPRVPETPPC